MSWIPATSCQRCKHGTSCSLLVAQRYNGRTSSFSLKWLLNNLVSLTKHCCTHLGPKLHISSIHLPYLFGFKNELSSGVCALWGHTWVLTQVCLIWVDWILTEKKNDGLTTDGKLDPCRSAQTLSQSVGPCYEQKTIVYTTSQILDGLDGFCIFLNTHKLCH